MLPADGFEAAPLIPSRQQDDGAQPLIPGDGVERVGGGVLLGPQGEPPRIDPRHRGEVLERGGDIERDTLALAWRHPRVRHRAAAGPAPAYVDPQRRNTSLSKGGGDCGIGVALVPRRRDEQGARHLAR